MTIKIEREALQCITNDVPLCSTPLSDEQQVDRIPEPRLKVCSNTSFPDLELTDDDSSVSSFSFSSSTTERRVTWSTPLVMEVNTRERTKLEDVRELFYSHEETQRFRQEYRLERRRAAELAASENESKDEHDNLGSSSLSGWSSSSAKDNCAAVPSVGRHRISRVVIMHKNTMETFFDQGHKANGNSGSTLVPIATVAPVPKTSASEDFFDNDSFWSGQITWY